MVCNRINSMQRDRHSAGVVLAMTAGRCASDPR